MSRKFLLTVTLALWSTGVLLAPGIARADTPLNRAVVQNLRNQVRILLKNQAPRPARTADTMTPGDALSTARKSLAELRFNDNSLARIGEQALFRFLPNTRTFRLDNGTVLLLIPPKQGQTRVRTPNAAAGIRGSALFVRYNSATDTTIVGALTNSRIEVFNKDETQNQELKAGQLAVIIQNRIERIYNFDLNTFYETSDLVKDLDLPQRSATPSADPAIALVQQETAEAVRNQAPIRGQGIVENPGFLGLNSPAQAAPGLDPQNPLEPTNPEQNPSRSVSPVLTGRPLQEGINGRQPRNPDDRNGGPINGGGPGPQPGPTPIPVDPQPGPTPPPPVDPQPGPTPPPTNTTPNDPPPTTTTPPPTTNAPPGQGGEIPGQTGAPPPGQSPVPPGQNGTTPGQGGSNSPPPPGPGAGAEPPKTPPVTTNSPPTTTNTAPQVPSVPQSNVPQVPSVPQSNAPQVPSAAGAPAPQVPSVPQSNVPQVPSSASAPPPTTTTVPVTTTQPPVITNLAPPTPTAPTNLGVEVNVQILNLDAPTTTTVVPGAAPQLPQ